MPFKVVNFFYGLMIGGIVIFSFVNSAAQKTPLSCPKLFGKPISDFKPLTKEELQKEISQLVKNHKSEATFYDSVVQKQMSKIQKEENEPHKTKPAEGERSKDFFKPENMHPETKEVSISAVLEKYIGREILSRLFENPDVTITFAEAYELKSALDWFVNHIKKIPTLEGREGEFIIDIFREIKIEDLIIIHQHVKTSDNLIKEADNLGLDSTQSMLTSDTVTARLRTLTPSLENAVPERLFSNASILGSVLEQVFGKERTNKLIVSEDYMPLDQYVFKLSTESKKIQNPEQFGKSLKWLIRYIEEGPAFVYEEGYFLDKTKSSKVQARDIVYDMISNGRFIGLSEVESHTSSFKQHINVLERYIGKQKLLEILFNMEVISFEALTPQNLRNLSYNLEFLSTYIESVPSLKDQSKNILSSIFGKEAGLMFLSQMERNSKDKSEVAPKLLSFLEDYVGGDKRIVISLLREENLTSWASDFNVYAFVKNNLESIESFINSTPGYEGQGKMMIVNGFRTGQYDTSLFFSGFSMFAPPEVRLFEVSPPSPSATNKERIQLIEDLFPQSKKNDEKN